MFWIKNLFSLLVLLFLPGISQAAPDKSDPAYVAVINLNMMILPGTQYYLEDTIKLASSSGAKAIIVKLDTPGGVLNTSQSMIQAIFNSPIPIFIYVAPTGATATSAGVFITMAGHIAAMSPGTSIGAAHPVTGEGKDIEGDMRAKAENMTIAMVKSITEERGRNLEWAEKAVKESNSITEKEALQKKVVDFIAGDIPDLLKQAAGREVKVAGKKIKLGDYSGLPVKEIEMSYKNKALNFFSHPNIAALLWLGATTGLTLELYNPGAILPGVVGVICLILAIAVMQIIPVTQTGIILMAVGTVLIILEMFFTSGALAVGGIVAIVLGALWLVDPSQAPGLSVNLEFIIPVAILFGAVILFVAHEIIKAFRQKETTGSEGMVGLIGKAASDFVAEQSIFVNGETWKARLIEGDRQLVLKGSALEVTGVDGLVLEVKIKI